MEQNLATIFLSNPFQSECLFWKCMNFVRSVPINVPWYLRNTHETSTNDHSTFIGKWIWIEHVNLKTMNAKIQQKQKFKHYKHLLVLRSGFYMPINYNFSWIFRLWMCNVQCANRMQIKHSNSSSWFDWKSSKNVMLLIEFYMRNVYGCCWWRWQSF